jgi:hypothetical protein
MSTKLVQEPLSAATFVRPPALGILWCHFGRRTEEADEAENVAARIELPEVHSGERDLPAGIEQLPREPKHIVVCLSLAAAEPPAGTAFLKVLDRCHEPRYAREHAWRGIAVRRGVRQRRLDELRALGCARRPPARAVGLDRRVDASWRRSTILNCLRGQDDGGECQEEHRGESDQYAHRCPRA